MRNKLRYTSNFFNNSWYKDLSIDVYVKNPKPIPIFCNLNLTLFPVLIADNTIISISSIARQTQRKFSVEVVKIGFTICTQDIYVAVINTLAVPIIRYELGYVHTVKIHEMYAIATDYYVLNPSNFMPIKAMYLAYL